MQPTMRLAQTDFEEPGKRITPPQVATTEEGCLNSRLFYVSDKNSGLNFLVDTGAALSIIPKNKTELGRETSSVTLKVANKTKIATFGLKTLTLDLGFRRQFPWIFTVADLDLAILGMDFLERYEFLVDTKKRRLTLKETSKFTKGIESNIASLNLIQTPPVTTEKFQDILAEFPNLTKSNPQTPKTKLKVCHIIKTEGAPVFAKRRRLAPDKLKIARAEFDYMLQLGIIRPSDSQWASPLHMVRKKNKGDWRPCGDYRALNRQTVPDGYPIPYIQDFTNGVQDMKVFTKIDLVRANHNIPVAEEDIPKTAITTPFGLFEFVRMPFGLRNAAQTFQRFMDNLLRDMPFAQGYIDDLLIASPDLKSHEQHVRAVLGRLNQNGMNIHQSKCVFGVETLEFLGHTISPEGITPIKQEVDTIKQYPIPSSLTQLRSCLGLINIYRRFIPGCAQIMQPLKDLLKGKPKEFKLTSEAVEALNQLKNKLARTATLTYPNSHHPFALMVDASDKAVGGTHNQLVKNAWKAIAFFSKKLAPAKTRYSTFSRELLAIYLTIKHFRHMLEGREFTVYTDHKPLTNALKAKADKYSPREVRHLDYISQFTSDIRHVKGQDNQAADALSRLEMNVMQQSTINVETLRDSQENDLELQNQLSTKSSSLKLKQLPSPMEGVLIYCDTTKAVPRPFVPKNMRRLVFGNFHSLSHPGVKSSIKLINAKYIWPNLQKDVLKRVRECSACQQSKVNRHTNSPIASFPQPDARFAHVHIDLVGPLPRSNGFTYLFTCIDKFTRFPIAVPITNITAETVAKAFMQNWVTIFGTPITIATDRGAQFESELFNNLAKLLGSNRIRCTAYHPQADGMVKQFYRQLKASLISHSNPSRWTEFLPLVMLGIRTAVKTDSQCSAAELVFGTTLRLPGEFINPHTDSKTLDLGTFADQLRDQMSKLKPINTREQSRATFLPKNLSNCSHVWIRCDKIKAPLSPPFEGPFKVISRKPKYFVIQKQGNIDSVCIDRLKPAYLDNEPPYVLLDRLPDQTNTEIKNENVKAVKVAKTVRWAQPIIQAGMPTFLVQSEM
uniref:Pol polyprotei n=1 Tax=Schistosoma japonicum TaxID=6182 RepID=C7C1Z7_SCHJA|nr:pol polyprotei [Schistosoma japonicum]